MGNCEEELPKKRPTVGQQTANSQPTVGRQTADIRPTGFLGSSSSQLPMHVAFYQCSDKFLGL